MMERQFLKFIFAFMLVASFFVMADSNGYRAMAAGLVVSTLSYSMVKMTEHVDNSAE